MTTLHANLTTAAALIETAAASPALPPNARLVAAIVAAGIEAIRGAAIFGEDVSDADLQALLWRFDVNRQDDLQAQAEATEHEAAERLARGQG